jgi:hypothetical protein
MTDKTVSKVFEINAAFVQKATPATLRSIDAMKKAYGLPLWGYYVGDTGHVNTFVKKSEAEFGHAQTIESGYVLTEVGVPQAQQVVNPVTSTLNVQGDGKAVTEAAAKPDSITGLQ